MTLKRQKTNLTQVQTEFETLLEAFRIFPHSSVCQRAKTEDGQRRSSVVGAYAEAVLILSQKGTMLIFWRSHGYAGFEGRMKITVLVFCSDCTSDLAHDYTVGLTQFMINTHADEHGYSEVYVPYLSMRILEKGTGQFLSFEATC